MPYEIREGCDGRWRFFIYIENGDVSIAESSLSYENPDAALTALRFIDASDYWVPKDNESLVDGVVYPRLAKSVRDSCWMHSHRLSSAALARLSRRQLEMLQEAVAFGFVQGDGNEATASYHQRLEQTMDLQRALRALDDGGSIS